ncbi:MAG: HlyD family efflux transporter periplasmic adaptor subunit [Bacteroidetes bacterium]|nr:HlyD family efflux transporter periplasmic adaptor subunit [Bacteroidota bacterium]
MKLLYTLSLSILILASCGGSGAGDASGEAVKTVTPVTVTSPENISLNEEITLNATSTYLLKFGVKANINGYIQSSSVKMGQSVSKGSTLFVLKTKEAKSLGNTINKLDPSFNFSGLNRIKSPVNGFITNLNHQTGDYVQDGQQLAELTDKSSFGFLMSLPYEYNQLLAKNKNVTIHLPDGRNITGIVAQIMPALDSATQTQKVLIKIPSQYTIPENLIATIAISKNTSSKISLPKESVLADESQQKFWVMKMINDSTAVKIFIKKGIEANNRIEILSPDFTGLEKILLSGNYGLADTALVKIKH